MRVRDVLIFTTGVAAGVGGSFYFFRDHFRKIADDEIASVKDYYHKSLEEFEAKMTTDIAEDFDKSFDKENAKNLANTNNMYKEAIATHTSDYTGYFEGKSEEAKTEAREDGPYIISDLDFTENHLYDKITWTYYEEDGVFTNIEDEPVDEALECIGEENLEHFGGYEEGILYVRNELTGTDYEIIYDAGSYKDFIGE